MSTETCGLQSRKVGTKAKQISREDLTLFGMVPVIVIQNFLNITRTHLHYRLSHHDSTKTGSIHSRDIILLNYRFPESTSQIILKIVQDTFMSLSTSIAMVLLVSKKLVSSQTLLTMKTWLSCCFSTVFFQNITAHSTSLTSMIWTSNTKGLLRTDQIS